MLKKWGVLVELLFPHARLQPAVDAFTLPPSIEVSRSPEDTKEYGRYKPGLNHGGVRGIKQSLQI